MWPLAGPAPVCRTSPYSGAPVLFAFDPPLRWPSQRPGEDLESTALPASQDHQVLKHQMGAHEATASLSLYVYKTEEAIS